MANPTTKNSPLSLLILQALFLYFLLYPLLMFNNISTSLAQPTTYNVVEFGANPNGQTDSTEAFLGAWNKACGSPNPASIYVPQGQFLLGTPTKFSGQCVNGAISMTIDGTLVAPSDYRLIGDAPHWLTFDQVSGVSIHGGVLDGQGASLWDCKSSGKANCPIGAVVCMLHMHVTNANCIHQ